MSETNLTYSCYKLAIIKDSVQLEGKGRGQKMPAIRSYSKYLKDVTSSISNLIVEIMATQNLERHLEQNSRRQN